MFEPQTLQGLLQVCGGPTNSHLSFEAKSPITLSARNHVGDLPVQYMHAVRAQMEENHVLSIMQKRFWKFTGRDTTKGFWDI